jgi:hypothetical protein
MDPNAQRSRGRAPEADAYWQRRFLTLVAGLGVIGLLAWACSGIVGGKPASSRNGQVSPAAYGSAAPGQPAGSGGMPSQSAPAQPTGRTSASPMAPSVSRSASATASASASASVAGHAGQRPPAKARASVGPCPAAEIVLTLVAGKASYRPHDLPVFQIDVVSTSAATCTVDTGPGALRVIVVHGSQVAWNSGACLHGASPHVISLRRGVPVVTSVAWNRHLTVTGCPTTVMAATNRTYTAVAQAAGAQSPGQSFRLTEPAAPSKPKSASGPT